MKIGRIHLMWVGLYKFARVQHCLIFIGFLDLVFLTDSKNPFLLYHIMSVRKVETVDMKLYSQTYMRLYLLYGYIF